MESVLRPTFVYLFVLVLLRLTGRRTLAQITTFDFVLLLIISEATQQALIGVDNSMINSAIVVSTLIGLNILMSLLKQRSRWFDRLLDDIPVVIVSDGLERGDPSALRDAVAKLSRRAWRLSWLTPLASGPGFDRY